MLSYTTLELLKLEGLKVCNSTLDGSANETSHSPLEAEPFIGYFSSCCSVPKEEVERVGKLSFTAFLL